MAKLLADDDAKRIADAIATPTDAAILTRWVRELLADRQLRIALLQRLSRRVHYSRQRVAQAFRYIDRLFADLEDAAREPWPGKIPCPLCGAAPELIVAEPRPDNPQARARGGYVLVHHHPDGTTCEPALASEAENGGPASS